MPVENEVLPKPIIKLLTEAVVPRPTFALGVKSIFSKDPSS